MNKCLVGLFVSILIALPACAEKPTAVVAKRVHVNVAEVEASGVVQAVDGITSSAQPNKAALKVFAESGYVAVVDLRRDSENRGLDERAEVEKLGLDYVQLPIDGGDGVTFENAGKLEQILAGYDGPVLVHCGSGNRVGAVLALRESLNGADDDDALEYGKSAGLTGHEAIVRQRLEED